MAVDRWYAEKMCNNDLEIHFLRFRISYYETYE